MSTQNKTAHPLVGAVAADSALAAVSEQADGQHLQSADDRHPEKKQKNRGAGYLPLDVEDELEAEHENFKPLTRQQADDVRRQIRPVSVARVLVAQCVAGVVVAMISWGVTGRQDAGWSAFYGALAVIVPASLFARGLSRQKSVLDAGSALMGFFVWELVKIGVTVAMLLAAPRLVPHLSWLALLAGFVVTMKVYWLATWLQLAHTKSIKMI
jgi:ATP synthase protein I